MSKDSTGFTLFSLRYWCTHGDLIEMFKIVKIFEEVKLGEIFNLMPNKGIRRHCSRLRDVHTGLQMTARLFTDRVISPQAL